jgi:arginase
LAVKIVRQTNKIALISAPSSAAGFAPGLEKAPAALRAAGLVEKLQSIGYEVVDFGEGSPRLFADDDEHPRARNVSAIVAALNDLKPRAELAAKSGGLVLVLGGDCVQTVALLAGLHRYYKHLSLIWFDRDADLNTPASTPSGRLDGMALAGIIGKGSPELVRFWGEPPLVREPDTLIFGLERVDPPEQEFLTRSPLRHVYAADIQLKGASSAAQNALAQLHADARDFVLHLDLDVIAQEEFPATNVPGSGGLSFAEVEASLGEFAKQKSLLALDVSQYNPDKDPDGSGVKKLVDLLVGALAARFAALGTPAAPAASPPPEPLAATEPASVAEPPVAESAPGEPALAESSSSDPAPVEPAPTESAPAEAAPADPAPSEPSSGDSSPNEPPNTGSSSTSA